MIGSILASRYKILEELGKGGFGAVYLAESLGDGRQNWAIKALDTRLKDARGAQRLRELFDREQKILSWLSHPAIVRRQEVIVEGARVFLVMEYVEGDDLRGVIRRMPRGLSPVATVNIAQQVCEILAYLHSQKPNPIVYRDLKPSNLMVDRQGRVKRVDFGIARLSRMVAPTQDEPPVDEFLSAKELQEAETVELAESIAHTSQDTHCFGTPGYAAPEQYPGSGMQSDPRADIYALGVIIFHLITGENPAKHPVPLPSLRSICVVDPFLDSLVQRATAPERDNRFPSARIMARALADIRARLPDSSLLSEMQSLTRPRRGTTGEIPALPALVGLSPRSTRQELAYRGAPLGAALFAVLFVSNVLGYLRQLLKSDHRTLLQRHLDGSASSYLLPIVGSMLAFALCLALRHHFANVEEPASRRKA